MDEMILMRTGGGVLLRTGPPKSRRTSLPPLLLSLRHEHISGGTVTACLHTYTDFWGADIESFNVVNVEECAMRCKARSGCKSITYHATDKYCWLKRKEFGENGKSDHSSVHSLNIACVKG